MLAKAHATRPWLIFAHLTQNLIGIARRLYASVSLDIELDVTLYAFDTTTNDLCLSIFS